MGGRKAGGEEERMSSVGIEIGRSVALGSFGVRYKDGSGAS